MTAITVPTFGDPDVLTLEDRATREPGAGEVRIAVAAAAVNPTDLLTRSGAASRSAEPSSPIVPGMDAAGIVDAVGPDVDRLAVGDRVMAAVLPARPDGGAYQSSLVVPAASVVAIPDGATLLQASTLPMNGLTAIEALDQLDLPGGATLLVTGGAGWLATLMIPLAKERGLRVVADARPDEHDLVRGHGADDVVDRGDGLADRVLALVPDGVDGALDTALIGPPLFPAIRDGGGWAVVRGQQDETERGIVRHTVFVRTRLEDTAALEHLRELASAGTLPLTVAETFPAERAADAHRRQDEGGVRGRLVITFAGDAS
ncbi:quinone oxidoreductase family protein [Patulibacter minatonensis]|uniref:quinone oxidoreductase family protein n=1 Tax=Patulibacter minatonensis TaxID=298163 RepID=UPI00047B064A|nr:NADP-dependent oxidoreductase [Patulibacter minatonensis]